MFFYKFLETRFHSRRVLRETLRFSWAALPLLMLYGVECASSLLPRVAGAALSGEKVELPRDLKGPVSFLIVSFSQKSADQAKEWGQAVGGLERCHGERPNWFQLPVIASAPSLVRPLIIRSIRGGLTRDLQPHFVVLTDHEAEWKLAVGYQSGDAESDAYVLAVDEKGQILARWHGPRQASEKSLQQVFEQYCGKP